MEQDVSQCVYEVENVVVDVFNWMRYHVVMQWLQLHTEINMERTIVLSSTAIKISKTRMQFQLNLFHVRVHGKYRLMCWIKNYYHQIIREGQGDHQWNARSHIAKENSRGPR